VKTPYTIPNLSNDTTEACGQWRATRQSKKDVLLEEMARIWTTLSLSQKEALMHEAIRASRLNHAIDHLQETAMARLDLRLQKKKENESLP
jgi:hypothetical protein